MTFPPLRSDFKDFKMKPNFWKFFSYPSYLSGKKKKKGEGDRRDSLNQQVIQWFEHLPGDLRDQPFNFFFTEVTWGVWNILFSLTGAAHALWAVGSSGVCYSQRVLLELCHII